MKQIGKIDKAVFDNVKQVGLFIYWFASPYVSLENCLPLTKFTSPENGEEYLYIHNLSHPFKISLLVTCRQFHH